MTCTATNIVGIFCISVILYDILKNEWSDLPYHVVLSILFITFFYGACLLLGDTISLAILCIPAFCIAVSLVTIWFTYESLNAQGCCMTCKNKPVDIKDPRPNPPRPNPPRPNPPRPNPPSKCVEPRLKATPTS